MSELNKCTNKFVHAIRRQEGESVEVYSCKSRFMIYATIINHIEGLSDNLQHYKRFLGDLCAMVAATFSQEELSSIKIDPKGDKFLDAIKYQREKGHLECECFKESKE